jgi:formylglycine-generating enzyme required for sulfatase activity
MANTRTFVWPEPFPPTWATDWGEDRYGLYAGFTVGNAHQRCRWIPPGRFMMGSPLDEPKRDNDEAQHLVTLNRGYWLADTACTQALWQTVTGNNPAQFKDDPQNPVEQVSWDDIQLFLQQLNTEVPALAAGLPTEAQWEYACRAGTSTPFSFGHTITTHPANYDGNYPYKNGQQGEYRGQTIPVKALAANPWGLYQMHGNVWEWCADWYAEYTMAQSVDPTGPETGNQRVVRGGSWISSARRLRSAYRSRGRPGSRNDVRGFRFAPGQVRLAAEPP